MAGGVDALIVENFGDAPFRPGRVDAVTVATMTRICQAVREQVRCPIGVNVLRSDAASALAIAIACQAEFIRVNVHTGVMATDQGLIQGRADETLRLRAALGARQIQIFADVLVKHAQPVGSITLEEAVNDLIERGLADAVIVSGRATGHATRADDVYEAVRCAAGVPVYVGSGVTVENVECVMPPASGVIVGSWLKRDGQASAPVELERVQRLRGRIDELRARAS
jgi:membrane complex biogenesis BtpA family protein